MEQGIIFNIQRFSVDDGPGIRTTVFMKGCPLSCVWCHNPESHTAKKEVFFYQQKCILCGGCAAVCKNGCHTLSEEGHIFDRTACIGCGACAEVCPTKALETAGRCVTVDEVMREVLSDDIFYKESGGGMTLSGGEPMAQPQFALALAKSAKEHGISSALETCGYCKWESLAAMLPYIDWFLFDYKAEADRHRELTGVDNDRILENLRRLSENGANIILRCPIIPDCNDTPAHDAAIAELARTLDGIREVHLEPYHPLGISKSEQLGREIRYNNRTFLDKKPLVSRAEQISAVCGKPVRVN